MKETDYLYKNYKKTIYDIDCFKKEKRYIRIETDEEKLDKIDIKVIESYIRKKKIERINKK